MGLADCPDWLDGDWLLGQFAKRRAVAKALKYYLDNFDDAKQGMAEAYRSGAYTLREIGEVFGVHEVTVGRAVRQREN